MLWETYRYFTYGWITRYFVEPVVTFPYYGFSWLKPWPGRGMYIHFFVLGLAAACVMAGFLYRIATPVFFLAFTYFFLLDQTRYLNHFYLVCLISFLMCFLPANRAFSVDALLRRKIRSDVVPAWTLWLLRAQVGIPYFFGGIAKLNRDWILGGEPMRTWLHPLTESPGRPHLRGRLGCLRFRDRRVDARPVRSTADPLATHAPLRIYSSDYIQSHQLRDIRYRYFSVVNAGRSHNLLSA